MITRQELITTLQTILNPMLKHPSTDPLIHLAAAPLAVAVDSLLQEDEDVLTTLATACILIVETAKHPGGSKQGTTAQIQFDQMLMIIAHTHAETGMMQ